MKWLAPLGRDSGQRTLLVCLPYAGGGAAVFRDWKALGDRFDTYAVRTPGRETRVAETPLGDVGQLADGLFAELAPLWARRRVVLFGHSLGASVAFEVARRGENANLKLERLVVSGRRAPQVPEDEEPIAHLPRAQFLEEMRTLAGTPPEFFDHEELVDLMLPALRADFAAAEQYLASPGAPLGCPILAYAGKDDDSPTPDQMRAWSEQTTGAFSLRVFAGDHFYLKESGPVIAALREDLP